MSIQPPNAIIDPQSNKIIVQQPLPPFTCMVLEGGGVRGAAYAGLFKILSKFGLCKDIQHVAGSSAGAIAALLVALGYTEDEITKELYNIPIDKFVEESASLMKPGLWAQAKLTARILRSKENSLSSGAAMQKWLEERIERKLGKKNATFADLKAKADSKENQAAENPIKELHVTATNISLKFPESTIFDYKNSPNVSIATAVRASSTFPYIFSPVEINGFKYIDGGCQNNLPCKIFDEECYLPPGYKLTANGMNPGILAAKIDSRHEIDQIIWGIRRLRPIVSVSEYTAAVAYAISDNVNSKEIRDSRTVIALPDQDIGSLNFSISTDGKLHLCSSAEEVAQEFLENIVVGAHKVKVYDSALQWLDSLSIEDLHAVIERYEGIQSATSDNSTKEGIENYVAYIKKYIAYRINQFHVNIMVGTHKIRAYSGVLQGLDLLNIDELNEVIKSYERIQSETSDNSIKEDYISYIKEYLTYRINKLQEPTLKFNPRLPLKHVNLSSLPINSWEKTLKENMLSRITAMKKNIEITEEKIANLRLHFSDDSENSLVQILHGDDFDIIKLLAGYIEYRDILSNEVAELEMKLDVKKFRYSPEKYNPRCNLFIKQIAEHAEDKNISSTLKSIISCVEISNPILTHKSLNDDDNILFSYHLRNTTDCKSFMIALILYLEHRNAKELPIYQELYSKMFNGETYPQSMYDFSTAFPNTPTSTTLVQAYRIEELILFFARRDYPNKKPEITLDKIFNSYKPFLKTIFPNVSSSTKDDSEKGTPMQNFFRVKQPTEGDNALPDIITSPSKQYRLTRF